MDIGAARAAISVVIDDMKDQIVRVSDQLYRFPETALQEHKSSTMLCEVLEKAGFVVERQIAGLATAFRASYGTAGPSFALLAEMDALPELGHACGHNVIAAATVGAALALRRTLPPETIRIVVLGTPAEEIGVGKIELINAGFFQDIDFAMMVHPSSRRQVLKMYLGLARIRFTFFGRSAHAAAYPDEGINALDAVIQTFNGINALRQHLRDDVRVHGIITEGGTVPNVIPEKASCFFYVRAEDMAELMRVKAKVIACAQGAALAAGCRLVVDEDRRVLAPLKINRAFSRIYSSQLRHLGLTEATAPPHKNKGSSDIGNVSQIVPTIHPHVPIGEGVHIHTEQFALATVSEQGKAAAIEGALALAFTAAELALSSQLRDEVHSEFALVG